MRTFEIVLGDDAQRWREVKRRDLLEAIRAHQSGSTYGGDASEANRVIYYFNNLQESQKQDILNFLRSL